MASSGMLSSGIYGLFRLDGGPVDPRDVAALGLESGDVAGAAFTHAVDPHDRTALHRIEADDALTIFVGHIEEPQALAARLNVAPTLPAALLARAALERFGRETPAEMIGEWSLLHWDRRDRRLVLTMSAARRDRLFFAVDGPRVAVAPNLFALSRISWIGNRLDEAGLLVSIGRADLRAALREEMGDRTMLAKVRQLEPATRLTISAEDIRRDTTPILVAQPRWTGSFDDAVVASEETLRTILHARIARTAVPGVLLSGGLDSSTIAWLAASERTAEQRMILLTSVAPPGSGLADEAAFADAVADRIGLTAEHVSPPEDADIYRPSDLILGGASRPPMPVRHCLTETFQARGKALGATALFDGSFGEATLTVKFPLTTMRQRMRGTAGRLRRYLAGAAEEPVRHGPFHVRLSPARLAALPEAMRSPPSAPIEDEIRRPRDLWGYLPGADKALLHPNEFYPGALRMEFPFRDVRLLRLFAGFPADFFVHDGLDRAPVRHMLAGQLPDTIRLRRSGRPASPDHMARLQRQASAARGRIAVFRKAEVQEWIDLDWLDQALAKVAERGPTNFAESYEVQLTAITAEFLTWWRARS
jgi:asparagine synthase (glutamine-hydrolysing)